MPHKPVCWYLQLADLIPANCCERNLSADVNNACISFRRSEKEAAALRSPPSRDVVLQSKRMYRLLKRHSLNLGRESQRAWRGVLSSSVIDLLSPAWRLFSSLKVISAIKAADAAFFHSKSSVVDDRRTVCLTLTPIKGRECRGMEWNGNRLRVLWSERRIFTQRLPGHLGICKKTNCQVLGFVIPTPDLELMLKRISRNL